MSKARPWSVTGSTLTLAVRVTPKGGRDAVDGIAELADGCCVLRVRVRAVPQDGKANTAVVELVANALGVAPSRVQLTSGATNRVKHLTIAGDGAALAGSLEKLMREAAA